MSVNASLELKRYQINVYGHHLMVSSPYGEAHIRKVEQFLNHRMSTVASQSETYGPTNLAILVALNLADELLALENQKDEMTREWKSSLIALCDKLEDTLTKTGIVTEKSI